MLLALNAPAHWEGEKLVLIFSSLLLLALVGVNASLLGRWVKL